MAIAVSVRCKDGCDLYKGQLRTIMVLWWLQELAVDHKGGFCGLSVSHRLRVL